LAADTDERPILINDARLRIEDLELVLRDDPNGDRHVVTAFRMRLLMAEGQRDEARQVLDDFASEELKLASDDAERAKRLLQVGNLAMSSQLFEEAEGWYRQLVALAPNSYVLLAKSLADQKQFGKAVEVCIQAAPKRPAAEVAIVLSQLLTVADRNSDLHERVQPLIASALDENRDNVNLLMSIAVRHVTEDNYDEAIKLLRRVLELQPNHTLALNNLATLLSERPSHLDEARSLVEQAMVKVGRNPALLDTLGTILIRGGKNKEAIAPLEEAVAGVAPDPRYYFHLAVAYQRSGAKKSAQRNFDAARRHGLDHAILTGGDRELLADLERELFARLEPH
jgi:tetratricopeptide (TPR) repeat protein